LVTEEQALWWVNCEHPPELLRWCQPPAHWSDGPCQCVGGFVPAADGTLLVALADGLYDFEPKNGHMSLRVSSPFPEHVKLHECQCDRQGRFWSGATIIYSPMTHPRPRRITAGWMVTG